MPQAKEDTQRTYNTEKTDRRGVIIDGRFKIRTKEREEARGRFEKGKLGGRVKKTCCSIQKE